MTGTSPTPETEERETKACPYCGETILAVARKCKHCGEFLDGPPPEPESSSEPEGAAERRGSAPPARERASRPRKSVSVGRILLLLLVALLGVFLYLFLGAQIASNLEARCNLQGNGTGECAFSNTGWGPGSACVRVVVRDSKSAKSMTSSPVCSGTLWGSSSSTISFSMRAPSEFCGGTLDFNWRKACTMDVRRQ